MNRLSVERAAPLLAAALARDPHVTTTIDDLLEDARARRGFIWSGERSAAFVRVYDSGNDQRVCEVAPAGGDLDEIVNVAVPEIEEYARAEGCTQGLIYAGRDGWERALRSQGFERTTVVLRKMLT